MYSCFCTPDSLRRMTNDPKIMKTVKNKTLKFASVNKNIFVGNNSHATYFLSKIIIFFYQKSEHRQILALCQVV